MANSGPNTNGCQFFICTRACPELDGKHVVFGAVIDGFEAIDEIERVRVRGDNPEKDVMIVDSGEY